MRGIFQNAGQNCIGIERLIVHSSQYDDLYAILVERVRKLRLGSVLSPTEEGFVSTVDTGAMISRDRFRYLERLISMAEDDGAIVEEGGKEYNHIYHTGGAYFDPTVVGNATSDMEIAQTERELPNASICTKLMLY